MAEQNILEGNIKTLQQVIGDVKQHNEKTLVFERLNASIADMKKQIDMANKVIDDEIQARIKASTDAICDGFDKPISDYKEKLKSVQAEREKARLEGVKERINRETADLKKENEDLLERINKAFSKENISKVFKNKFLLMMYQSKGIKEIIAYTFVMLLMYLLIPIALFIGLDVTGVGLIIYYAAVSIISSSVSKYIYEKKIIPNYSTIKGAHDLMGEITANKKKMRKITSAIKKDKSDDLYGLHVFDEKIKKINKNIEDVEKQKKDALDEFEQTVKNDIINEIKGTNLNKINSMKQQLNKKTEEQIAADVLLKEQRIYISSNYEAYLGKDFVTVERLQALYTIMKSGAADTIGQAVTIYNNRR